MTDELKQLAAEETRGPESGESILHQKTWRAIWEIAQERGIALPNGDCTLSYLIRFLTTEVQRQNAEAAAKIAHEYIECGEPCEQCVTAESIEKAIRRSLLSPSQEGRNG